MYVTKQSQERQNLRGLHRLASLDGRGTQYITRERLKRNLDPSQDQKLRGFSQGGTLWSEKSTELQTARALIALLGINLSKGTHQINGTTGLYSFSAGSFRPPKSQQLKQALEPSMISNLNTDFYFKLNLSNRLLIDPLSSKSNADDGSRDPGSSGATKFYKYFLNKYNNADLVKRIFSRRSWWVPVKDATDARVNLVWTQFPIPEVLQKMSVAGWSKRPAASVSDPQEALDRHVVDLIGQSETGGNLLTKLIRPFIDLHLKFLPLDTVLAVATRQLHPDSIKPLPWETSSSQQRAQILHKLADILFSSQILHVRSAKASLCMNKLEDNWQYGHKSYMFLNLQGHCEANRLDIAEFVPETYYICPENGEGLSQTSGYKTFKSKQKETQVDPNHRSTASGPWLLKPAENTFGGSGIHIFRKIEELEPLISQIDKEPPTVSGKKYIIQKYIANPLLIQGRKFDIRAFLLLTSFNGKFKCYWYPEGYIRTSSEEFDLADVSNLAAHLTNDCYQKTTEEYGKFEKGNKIMYSEFFTNLAFMPASEGWECKSDSCNGCKVVSSTTQESVLASSSQLPWGFWLDTVTEHVFPENANSSIDPGVKKLFRHISSQMINTARHLVQACSRKIDPRRRTFSFELVGLDFMLDETLKVWLIEANNSPSLVVSQNPALNKFFESLIENVFTVAVDPIFPPPRHVVQSSVAAAANQFTLILAE